MNLSSNSSQSETESIHENHVDNYHQHDSSILLSNQDSIIRQHTITKIPAYGIERSNWRYGQNQTLYPGFAHHTEDKYHTLPDTTRRTRTYCPNRAMENIVRIK